MKKVKTLLFTLTTALLLTSCSGQAKFKEYSYKRILSDNEKAALLEKVEAATLGNVNKLEKKKVENQKADLHWKTIEEKTTWDFFTKGELFIEEVNKEEGKTAEKEYKKENTKKTSYTVFDEEKHYYAQSVENSLEGTYAYLQETINPGDEPLVVNDEFDDIICNLVGTGPGEMKAYEDKKGNFFFLTSIVTEKEDLEEYGHYKRVKHYIQKEQRVAFLNEDFSLKSMTYIFTYETNKDPDTKAFSKSLKETNSDTWTYTFTYGEKVDSGEKFAELRNNAKNGYMLSGDPTVKGTALKADGTELGDAPFTKLSGKQVSFNKHHFVYSIEDVPATIGTDAVASLKLKVNGYSGSNAKADPVEIKVDASVASLVAGNSGLAVENGVIKMGKAPVDLMVEFDLEATAEGATVSNVVVYAQLNVKAA